MPAPATNATLSTTMKKRVVIVGGGLAGLSAAHELSSHKQFDITVLEIESHIGGRAHTKIINGVAVDFGGFIIYPWYKTFSALLKKLGLTKELARIPLKDIFFDVHGDGTYEHTPPKIHASFHFLKFIWHLLIPGLRFQNSSRPHLNGFSGRTVQELLILCRKDKNTPSKIELYFDTVSQGYCYGSFGKYKAAFGVPMIVKSILYGSVKHSSYLKDGLVTMTAALVKTLEARGVTIKTDAPVFSIDPARHTIKTQREDIDADIIVLAQPANAIVEQSINWNEKKDGPSCEYTKFVIATVRFDKTPTVNQSTQWGAVFYKERPHQKTQILSSINLEALYGPNLAGHVNLNIRLLDDHVIPDADDLLDILYKDIQELFPDTDPLEIVEMAFWPHTMPIAQENFVRKIRQSQGKNNVFYAGDYLGCPSMETAVATGKYAAKLILRRHK